MSEKLDVVPVTVWLSPQHDRLAQIAALNRNIPRKTLLDGWLRDILNGKDVKGIVQRDEAQALSDDIFKGGD